VRNSRIWARILGVENTVVEAVEFDEDQGCVVVSVRAEVGGPVTVRDVSAPVPRL
jgi:hypothetical protein